MVNATKPFSPPHVSVGGQPHRWNKPPQHAGGRVCGAGGLYAWALPGGAKPSALLTMWGGGYTRIHLSYERQIPGSYPDIGVVTRAQILTEA